MGPPYMGLSSGFPKFCKVCSSELGFAVRSWERNSGLHRVKGEKDAGMKVCSTGPSGVQHVQLYNASKNSDRRK